MKKLIFLITFIAVVAITAGYNMYIALDKKVYMAEFILTNVEALAQPENGGSGNYSCTATVDCGLPLGGSVSCSGQRCSRGIDWTRGAYVECDGNKTFC